MNISKNELHLVGLRLIRELEGKLSKCWLLRRSLVDVEGVVIVYNLGSGGKGLTRKTLSRKHRIPFI